MQPDHLYTIGDVLKLRKGVPGEFFVIGIMEPPTHEEGQYFYRLVDLSSKELNTNIVFHQDDLKIVRKPHLGELTRIKPIIKDLGVKEDIEKVEELIQIADSKSSYQDQVK